MRQFSPEAPARVATLISGRGSNLASLIERQEGRAFRIVLVLSDRSDALGLDHARAAAIAHRCCEAPSKQAREDALSSALDSAEIDIVCLAGFMRVLSARFVERWSGRILNIHPSLLPAFRGLDTHRRALEAGVAIHGCTVHEVTAELDAGPIVGQAAIAVRGDDTAESLAARVLALEHALYADALDAFVRGAPTPIARFENRA